MEDDFRARRLKLAEAAAGLAVADEVEALVEIVPKPAVVVRNAMFVIGRDGMRLEFGDDFADDALRRAIMVLRSC